MCRVMHCCAQILTELSLAGWVLVDRLMNTVLQRRLYSSAVDEWIAWRLLSLINWLP